jgi:hypothetical protein
MLKLLSKPQTETSSPVFKIGDDVICQAYPGEEIYIANIKGILPYAWVSVHLNLLKKFP